MYFIARQKSAKAWLRKHLNRQPRVCLIKRPRRVPSSKSEIR
ncbi:hypothetical protein PUN28_008432 [Cardiocondyla obscurior]|uniref:Uncharacterized protein n=1 Tax=Cardiocondyla obscurior TaxID=286306 RepID=A0AAW2G2X6_9HYME